MSAITNRIFVACALVAFGLLAGNTTAFAKKRACLMVEASHVPVKAIEACLISGKDVLCDEVTGKAYCCNSNGTKCGGVISTLTFHPPGPRPPRVKVDIPRIDNVKQPPQPPRIDVPPSSIAPTKPPKSDGPVVR
jgi:hypothetical protein